MGLRNVVSSLGIKKNHIRFSNKCDWVEGINLTHTQAHVYNKQTRGMVTTRHRSLIERGGRKVLLETLHTHKEFKKTEE